MTTVYTIYYFLKYQCRYPANVVQLPSVKTVVFVEMDTTVVGEHPVNRRSVCHLGRRGFPFPICLRCVSSPDSRLRRAKQGGLDTVLGPASVVPSAHSFLGFSFTLSSCQPITTGPSAACQRRLGRHRLRLHCTHW